MIMLMAVVCVGFHVLYQILILILFAAKSPADKLRGDASPSSYQENSQASTLERLKDSIQEFLNKQDAMPKIQVFWPNFIYRFCSKAYSEYFSWQ